MEERKLKIGEKRVKMSGCNERGDIIKAFDSLNFINFTFKISINVFYIYFDIFYIYCILSIKEIIKIVSLTFSYVFIPYKYIIDFILNSKL